MSKNYEQIGKSTSIETQRLMLNRFCQENQLAIVDYYVDDGFFQIFVRLPTKHLTLVHQQRIMAIASSKIHGYVCDEETGLYYLTTRYYQAQFSRFINGDSIISSKTLLSMSTYAYCRNAPVNRTDSDGMEDIPAGIGHTIGCMTSGCDGCYSGPYPAHSINPYSISNVLPNNELFNSDYQLVEWHYAKHSLSETDAARLMQECAEQREWHKKIDVAMNFITGLVFPAKALFGAFSDGLETLNEVGSFVSDMSAKPEVYQHYIPHGTYTTVSALYKHPTEDQYMLLHTTSSGHELSALHGSTLEGCSSWEIPTLDWGAKLSIRPFVRVP